MRRTKSRLAIISLFLIYIPVFFSPCLYSQKENILFKHIAIEEDFSQVSVNCILQDRRGFMWFGTQEGLNRYDGYEFKCYKHDPEDQTTITDSYIWSIIEDKSGILWVGTNDGGLNAFDPMTEQFTPYQNDPNDGSSLSYNYVRSIFEDSEGLLWIGTYGGGLNKFNRKTKKFNPYQYDPSKNNSLSNNNVTSIIEDQFGNLWIGTDGGGINIYDQKTNKFLKHEYNKKGPNSLSNINVTCILKDRSGAIWIGTQGGGLNKFDWNTGKFERFTTQNGLSHNNVLCIFEDQNEILWIGTEGGGVNTFDRKTGFFTHHSHNAAIPHTLSNDVVRSIFEDKSGLIWIGTNSGGLNKYNPMSRQFALFQHYPGIDNSLSSNDIRAIYEDRTGTFWIGTYGGGLNQFNRKAEIFKNYTTEEGLSHNDVRCILEDHSGDLWIGTRGGGLNRLDRKKDVFTHYKNNPDDKDSLSNDWIRVIYKDHSGVLWIGTEGGGLNKLPDRNKKNFKRYQHDPNNPRSLSNDIVFSIFEDRSGFLWVGTRAGGLNKIIDQEKGIFIKYMNEEDNPKSMSHNFVLSIYEDQKGNLWIGTYGGGLNKMIDREKGIFKSYREKDGLPNNVIYGILEDNQGNLWLSTNKGISKFNHQNKSFRNFDAGDGLQSNEFNAGAYFKNGKTGEMFFGGINGFNAFSPENIKDDPSIPPVVITDFLVANKSLKLKRIDKDSPLSKPIYSTDSLTLSYRQNFFSFEFAALHYANPKKNRYKYKLEGWDYMWVETDAKNRRATYTNLPAGNYVFKVIGRSENGRWNENGTSLKIKILSPPWKTWWAYTLYFLALVSIVLLIWSAWSKRFLRQKVEERSKELKSIQSQLVQSEKMAALGTLLAGITHEINNPASFVQTAVYNLNKDIEKLESFLVELAGDEADKEILKAFDEKFSILFKHLAAIKEGTSRISKTVNDLRTFSRMDKGEKKRGNVQENLEATLNLIRANYKHHVDFITDFQSQLEVVGNAAELNQVFMNIMVNACQAIIEKQKSIEDNSKGTLTIKTFTQNNDAVISFQDTGIGMTEEVKRKMFDPFSTTRPVGEGTGLGLSISYGIINKHNGRIEVKTEIGKGTTITLYLPLSQKKKTSAEESTP